MAARPPGRAEWRASGVPQFITGNSAMGRCPGGSTTLQPFQQASNFIASASTQGATGGSIDTRMVTAWGVVPFLGQAGLHAARGGGGARARVEQRCGLLQRLLQTSLPRALKKLQCLGTTGLLCRPVIHAAMCRVQMPHHIASGPWHGGSKHGGSRRSGGGAQHRQPACGMHLLRPACFTRRRGAAAARPGHHTAAAALRHP